MPEWVRLNWATAITAAVAIYGAILSTVNYRAQRRRDRWALKLTLGEEGTGGMFEPMLELRAVNVGHRPVHLAEAAIVLPSGEEPVWGGRFASHDQLPCRLTEGRKFTATAMVNAVSVELLQKGFAKSVKLRARVTDETGGVHVSKPHRFRIRQWVAEV